MTAGGRVARARASATASGWLPAAAELDTTCTPTTKRRMPMTPDELPDDERRTIRSSGQTRRPRSKRSKGLERYISLRDRRDARQEKLTQAAGQRAGHPMTATTLSTP